MAWHGIAWHAGGREPMLAYLTQMAARIGALSPLASHMVGIDQVK